MAFSALAQAHHKWLRPISHPLIQAHTLEEQPESERDSTGGFLESLAFTGGISVSLGLLFFGSGTAAARILGPIERGALAAVQATAGLILTLGELGASDALVYESARAPTRVGTYLFSAILITATGLSCSVSAGYFAIPYLLHAQTFATVEAARLYLLLAISVVFLAIPHAALRGYGSMRLWNLLRFEAPITWLGAIVIAALARNPTATMVVEVYLVIRIAASVPLGLWICRTAIPGRLDFDIPAVLRMLRYGVPEAASHFPKSLNLRADQILMAAMLPPRLLGLYVVAVAWSGIAGPLPNAIGLVLFPHVASQPKASRAEALARVTRLTVPVLVLTGVILCIATPWGIPLVFGTQYIDSIPAGYLLILAALALQISQILEEGLRGMGNTVAILRGQISGLVVTIVALTVLLRPWGIVGAATASLLGYSTITISLISNACRTTGARPVDFLVPSFEEVRAGVARVANLARTMLALA